MLCYATLYSHMSTWYIESVFVKTMENDIKSFCACEISVFNYFSLTRMSLYVFFHSICTSTRQMFHSEIWIWPGCVTLWYDTLS